MTEKQIRERLVSAVENNTPDILEGLMAELDIKDEPKELMRDVIAKDSGEEDRWVSGMSPKKVGRAGWVKAAAGCVAAAMIVTAGISLSSARKALAVVSLDVNPGIEIKIDKNERVMKADAVNEEAAEILADMDLKGSDIDVACNAIVGSMLTRGYLTDDSNSILLSVSAEDGKRGTEIEKRLSGDLNSYLEDTEVAAAILGKAVNSDESVKAYAKAHGISLGKAWLIQSLLNTGSTKMTEEDLLSLSTQDLILLAQKRGVAADTTYGDAESGGYIGNAKALSIALEKAGVSRSDAANTRYELDCENGVVIYEVSFSAGGYEYDYDINARDGSIISYEKENETAGGAPSPSGSAVYYYDDDDDDRDDDYDHDDYVYDNSDSDDGYDHDDYDDYDDHDDYDDYDDHDEDHDEGYDDDDGDDDDDD